MREMDLLGMMQQLGVVPPDKEEASSERKRLAKLASSRGGEAAEQLRHRLRSAMWHKAGIIRSGPSPRKG
jgi:succinate dehydrogenase/fumarate reductase flavoprotein subunit